MQVVVEARELKSMFTHIRPILRNAMDGGLMGFAVENHVLTVTCKNGIIFEQKFAVELDGPIYSTVIYRDVAELLPGSGQATVDISEKAVMLATPTFSTTFVAAYGEVRPYARRVIDYAPCKGADYKRIASAFAELSPVAKSLKRESSVILSPPHAICKYPTVWLEVAFKGLTTSIGTRELRTIANFNPKYYGVTESAVEFINGASMMAFPITPVGEVSTCKQIIVEPSAPMKLSSIPALQDVLSFARAVHGACRLSFFSDGYVIQYKNQEVEMQLHIGDCKGERYITLDTYTEYLGMMFKLIEDKEAYVIYGKNAIMLEVPNELRLLHSIII